MTDDWLETQRKYWDEWTELGRKSLGIDIPRTNAWEGAMDHWWQALAPAAPDLVKDFMEKMMEQGKMFFRMADTFTRDLSSAKDVGADSWQVISQTLEDIQKTFRGSYESSDESLHKMLAFWELPYDNWQRMASSLSPVPGDLLRNMPHDQVKEGVHRFLSAPGLGYTREEQSQYQDLMRKTLDYQRALQEYMSFFSHIGVKSTDRMRESLQDLAKADKTVDSARTLYDVWVGCCEDVYAEEVQTTEYARVHGGLVNALMALKQRMSVIVDETLGTLNMPTRSELRTLQDRLQETRRETKALRHELAMLKKQVAGAADATKGSPAASSKASATAAAAPKKKATVRKKRAAAKKTTAKPTNS
jgi:class III poly(R)-hydroxyalkanoic acid synthase PhaE subunit